MKDMLTVMVPVVPRQASGAAPPQQSRASAGAVGCSQSAPARQMWRRPFRMISARCRKEEVKPDPRRGVRKQQRLPQRAAESRQLGTIAAAKAPRSTTGLEFMLETRHVRSEWHGDAATARAGTLEPFRSSRSVSPIRFHQQTRGSRDLLAPAARSARSAFLHEICNGQQNAHRRRPSGGDPGGGAAWHPRRRIRLRIRKP